jgi:hypothetical protein
MMSEVDQAVSDQQMADQPVRFRLAKPSDARALARLHYICSLIQPDGFMYRLGERFLTQYYRILLDSPASLILCAEAGTAGIIGLVSASIDAGVEFKALQKRRLRLLLAALPALVRRPKLIRSVRSRERSLSAARVGEGFVVASGARLAFWAWSPAHPSGGQATRLLRTAMKLLKALGVESARLEVDRVNRKVEAIHRLMGGKVIDEFVTGDGRRRIVIEHML